MKPAILLLPVILLAASCKEGNHALVRTALKGKVITISNGDVTLTVDNNLHCRIISNGNLKEIQVTGEIKESFISGLADSSDRWIPFFRKNARRFEINDQYGEGEGIQIESVSGDNCINCITTISSYKGFQGVFLVRAQFRNISKSAYPVRGYHLDHLRINPPEKNMGWWTFQGASYHWGQDFIFQLPDSFSRENFMGLNGIKEGSGIPVADVWNREFGVAVACISDRPEYVSIPVTAGNGSIRIGISDKTATQVILPGDSLVTVQTAIIIHAGDFFDPMRVYARLMKPLLPEFQFPPDQSFQPEWCTWGYDQDFKRENILDRLGTFKEMGIHTVIIDDGWSVNHGDWVPDRRKFPAGDADFRSLIRTLHDNGLKVWLWWVPGYVDSTSDIAALHPDWLIQNRDGSVHQSYGLCPAYTPVQEHYKQVVRKFTEDYRLDGFKLDFREINSAPPCYNPAHHHQDAWDSYRSTPLLFHNICRQATQLNPQIIIEYCSCGIPPNFLHLPYANLAVTSDPNIGQITNRIKMYKALMGDDFPVLEEYCGVLAGPIYQMTIGAGGVPGTFSTVLDPYHRKWLDIYHRFQLSKGEYLNLYDIGFDYPETHVIKKSGKYYYAFYTRPWKKLKSPWWFRFGEELISEQAGKAESDFPVEPYSGKLELRGLDPDRNYSIVDYEHNREMGTINGRTPFLEVSFDNYLLLEATPVN